MQTTAAGSTKTWTLTGRKSGGTIVQYLKQKLPLIAGVAFVFLFVCLATIPAIAQDASGANTGTIKDVQAATAGKPTLEEIGNRQGIIRFPSISCGRCSAAFW